MMDFVFVAAIVGFFAVSVGLVRFCAGLLSGGRPAMNWVYWLSGVAALRDLRLPDRRAVQAGDLRMNTSGWLQLALYVVVLLLLAKPLGAYMAAVYEGRAVRAQRIGGWLERLIYRGAGVDPQRDMSWIDYALAMLWFNLLGALVVYALQRLQVLLPLNPQAMAAVSPDSAFNTATSFATNTNWQGYGGETHDELSDADAGPRRPELRLGRDRAWPCWSR